MMDSTGVNIDIWGISLLSFTCLYTVVTGKLIVYTRWWTKVSVFFLIFMSIFVYIGYVWISNYLEGSRVRYSVIQVHLSPVFYITLFLVGMSCFLGDILMEFFRLEYNKNASDFLRTMIKHFRHMGIKGSIRELEIEDDEIMEASGIKDFMKPIEYGHRVKSLRRESTLDKLRLKDHKYDSRMIDLLSLSTLKAPAEKTQLTQDHIDYLRKIFFIMDQNGDGVVDRKDLTKLLENLGEVPTDEYLDALISYADIDCNGLITF